MIFKTKLIDKDKSYTFSDYFSLNIKKDKLLNYFNYTLKNETSIFKDTKLFKNVDILKNNIIDIKSRVIFDSEIARRELLIAPIILKLMQEFKELNLSIEEKIEFNNLLKGKLDYLLSTDENLLIVEAKNADLEAGYKQLAVEMITIDKLSEEEKLKIDFIYGVISTGIEWQFVILNREKKEFISDSELYILPRDLEKILGIFVKILKLEKGK